MRNAFAAMAALLAFACASAFAQPALPACAESDAACVALRADAHQGRAEWFAAKASSERLAAEADRVLAAQLRDWPLEPEPIETPLPPGSVTTTTVRPAQLSYPEPGAFRVNCNPPGPIGTFDFIVFPGQAGAGHPHDFSGGVSPSPNSTYASMRAETRPSTCGGAANQSIYWRPVLVGEKDGRRVAVRPGADHLYYKRYALTDPECNPPLATRCAGLPTGLHIVAAYDMKTMTYPGPQVHWWYCVVGNNPVGASSRSMAEPVRLCQQPGSRLYLSISFPDCWDGRHVDSPDHRSHMAYRGPNQHQGACPATHPVGVPKITEIVGYDVTGVDPASLHLSSDEMHNSPAGTTLHADYAEGWQPSIRKAWERECLDKRRSCSGGHLGDGRVLVNPAFRADVGQVLEPLPLP